MLRFKEKCNGYFTVEAALVMPIVLFVIYALFYLSFYLHDICRIQNVADMVLSKAAFSIKHIAEINNGKVDYENINDRGVLYLLLGDTSKIEEDIKKHLSQELEDGLICSQIKEIKTKVSKFSIRIEVTSDFILPLKGVYRYFRPDKDNTLLVSCPIHNPAETVRAGEVLLESGKKIKGVEEFVNKIKNFLK